jgi:signal transduction histidine kinase
MAKGSSKASHRPYEDLKARARELNVMLAIAQEAVKAETARREVVEKKLQDLEKEHQLLMARERESAFIVQKLKEQIEESTKLGKVGMIMVPALAHDLGNLLTAVYSQAQVCMETYQLDSPLGESIRAIFENSRRARRLIKDFLDYVKLVKVDTLDSGPVNINDLVTSMWNIVKLDAGPQRATFRAQLGEVPEVLGDMEKLERVFMNLLLNAIQAVSEEGKVTVQTRFIPSEGMVEVSIMDNGPGIPEHHRRKIFEPFFTTKEDGTGLGLSICQSIIQQHEGTITVAHSEREGTKFSVKLPAANGISTGGANILDTSEDGMEVAY